MCGIAGILHLDQKPVELATLEAMTQAVRHRGPDGFGFTGIATASGGSFTAHNRPIETLQPAMERDRFDIGFGHRRLSIIDLSDLAAQPMQSRSGTAWLTYNGEIYNHIELRGELEARGHAFSSHSDTEVVLQAYEEWGEGCLEHLSGMFAFAIWDQEKKQLFCARDRFGMKPFYYSLSASTFLFGSEIKQLFLHRPTTQETNDRLVYDYLRHGFTDHSNETMFKDVRQLEPGQCLILRQGSPLRIVTYYQPGKQTAAPATAASHAEYFKELFSQSVKQHLRSDVTVGSCLSGGLDSSSIVCSVHALLKGASGASQVTFTSCFNDKKFDEREHVQEVIRLTRARSIETFPDLDRVIDDARIMLAHHDEPWGSTSQYSQWHLFSTIKSNGVKVVLDGQGADEILAGYHSCYGAYFLELARALKWGFLFGEVRRCQKHHGYKAAAIVRFIISSLAIDLFGMHLGFLRPRPAWMADGFYSSVKQSRANQAPRFAAKPLNHFLGLLLRYNLSALLRFEDRSSMAHSVEARLPFLDHRLVDFLFSLPAEEKIRDGWTKAILRQSFKNLIPEKIRLRKDKMGFVTPEEKWLRSLPEGSIREILNSPAARQAGHLNIPEALAEVLAIRRGEKPFSFLPWRILNYCLWMEKQNKID